MYWKLCLVYFAGLFIHTKGGGGPSPIPISNTEPNYPGGRIANTAIPGPFLADFKPPFPTNGWWGAFMLENQNATAAGPFPFQSATTNTGLRFGMSDSRKIYEKSLIVRAQTDFIVGITGLPDEISNRKATYWDTQAVCLQYFNGQGGTMDSCLVPGSPYMTFKFTNSQIQINSNQGDITSFSVIETGKKYKANLQSGGTYLIYVVDDISVTITRNGSRGLISPLGTTATLRFAKLKDPSQEVILDTYASTYPTGLDFKYAVDGDISTVTWTWDVVGDPNKLLMLSYHHHRQQLQNPEYENIEYLVLLGKMKGIKGNIWFLKYNLPTINFHAQDPVHSSCLEELNRTLEVEVNNLEVRIPAGFYFWGQSFARDSRLALIAEEIGRLDLIPKVLQVLKDSIQPWYKISFQTQAAYETNWGGLIDRSEWNSMADTEIGLYTNHHSKLAYIIHGAAIIGKYDPAWLRDHADFIDHVCRDIGNPSPNDPYHTVARHMDFFQGHSWDSGVDNDGGGRGQISSSEAINAWYSMVLWGHTTQNQHLIDWARLLIVIEMQGSMTYYHLYPNALPDATPYPEKELRNYVSVGYLGDARVRAYFYGGNFDDNEVWTWSYWESIRYQNVANQILPLTPIVKIFADIPWMEEVMKYCREELENSVYGDSIKSVIYGAYANVNPKQAHNYSTTLADLGSGNSHSNTLYILATNPSPNEICSKAWIQPEGQFIIQEVASGKYVTTSAIVYGNLSASTTVESEAAKFLIEFSPGGSYIQSISNGSIRRWVSASPAGSLLSANKYAKTSYELFKWIQVSESAGTYRLQATVNKVEVATAAADGGLYNTAGVNGAVASIFKLISVSDPLPSTTASPPPTTARTTLPPPTTARTTPPPPTAARTTPPPPTTARTTPPPPTAARTTPPPPTTARTTSPPPTMARTTPPPASSITPFGELPPTEDLRYVHSSPVLTTTDANPMYNIQHPHTERRVRGNNAGTTPLTATNNSPVYPSLLSWVTKPVVYTSNCELMETGSNTCGRMFFDRNRKDLGRDSNASTPTQNRCYCIH